MLFCIVTPSLVNIAGPFIRVLGDRFQASVKVAVLDTLALLLSKVSWLLREVLLHSNGEYGQHCGAFDPCAWAPVPGERQGGRVRCAGVVAKQGECVAKGMLFCIVTPSVVNIAGPLIHVLGDRFQASVKVAVLDTLALLLSKVSALLRRCYFA